MKKQIGLIFLLLTAVFLLGCSKESEEESESATFETVPIIEETIANPEPTEDKEEIPDGHVKSRLTGLFIPEELEARRPYTIMFNNIKTANPQSGIDRKSVV